MKKINGMKSLKADRRAMVSNLLNIHSKSKKKNYDNFFVWKKNFILFGSIKRKE